MTGAGSLQGDSGGRRMKTKKMPKGMKPMKGDMPMMKPGKKKTGRKK